MDASVSRRDLLVFCRRWSAALFADPVWAKQNAQAPAFAPTISGTGEAFWKSVREQFVMPADLGVLNAANLCPASRPVLEALKRESDSVDRDPSAQNRARLGGEKENPARRSPRSSRHAGRDRHHSNTSEAKTWCRAALTSSRATKSSSFTTTPEQPHRLDRKAKRFGFTVIEIPQVIRTGDGVLRQRLQKSITANTKILSFTQPHELGGRSLPCQELCALARENGVMSLVDGAQSFGLLDVHLAEIGPDFYTVAPQVAVRRPRVRRALLNARAQKNIWPSIYSAYSGAVGISRTFEGFGQRDEATMIAFREALDFQTKVGRAAIEKRSRELANQLIAGLSKLPDVKVWTSPNPSLNAAVVSFLPGSLNSQKLGQALYEKDKIGTADVAARIAAACARRRTSTTRRPKSMPW